MFTKRIIPCLDVNNGRVVKGVNFVNLRDAGDPVEIDFDRGVIVDQTKGTQYPGQAFPPFMQKIIKAEGLVNYINSNYTE